MLDLRIDDQVTARHAQHGLVLAEIHGVVVGADLLLGHRAGGGGSEELQHVLALGGGLVDGGAQVDLALLHHDAVLLNLELGHGGAEGLVADAARGNQLALLVQPQAEVAAHRHDGILASTVLHLHQLGLVAILRGIHMMYISRG